MKPEHDVTKLPKWARYELERLEANERHYKKLAEQAERAMLERGSLILEEGERPARIDWTISDGALELSAWDGVLLVAPRASNVVTLHVRPYGRGL